MPLVVNIVVNYDYKQKTFKKTETEETIFFVTFFIIGDISIMGPGPQIRLSCSYAAKHHPFYQHGSVVLTRSN